MIFIGDIRLMKRLDEDLQKLLDRFPILNWRWKHIGALRTNLRDIHADNKKIEKNHKFDAVPLRMFDQYNLKILFVHFSPFLYQIEGLGLPLYAAKVMPNSIVHFTYDKGAHRTIFNVDGATTKPINDYLERYDLVIARSSALLTMMRRPKDREVLAKSGAKVNIKPMGLSSNRKHADFYLTEQEFFAPASVDYRQWISDMPNVDPDNLIVMIGTLWNVKNQLSFFQKVDPKLLKDKTIVLVGPTKDQSYAKKILKVAEDKNIDTLMIGNVNQRFVCELLQFCKLQIIPLDARCYGQEDGVPRVLGEAIESGVLSLCSKNTYVPDEWKPISVVYNQEDSDSTNEKFQEAWQKAEEDFSLKCSMTFEMMCDQTLERCMKLGKLWV